MNFQDLLKIYLDNGGTIEQVPTRTTEEIIKEMKIEIKNGSNRKPLPPGTI